MAVKKLVEVWDGKNLIEDNIEFLRVPTKLVTFPVSKYIEQIVNDLIDTFKAVPCAGIAANQIGYDQKIFIGMKHDHDFSIKEDPSQNLDEVEPDPDNYEIYINPEIKFFDSSSTQLGDEGCLSLPHITLNLERYDKIKVVYYNLEGRSMPKPPKPLKGFISRLFQHELDHLNGKLMLESKNILNAQIAPESDEYKGLTMQLMKYLGIIT